LQQILLICSPPFFKEGIGEVFLLISQIKATPTFSAIISGEICVNLRGKDYTYPPKTYTYTATIYTYSFANFIVNVFGTFDSSINQHTQ
jgi:hypothetical protein